MPFPQRRPTRLKGYDYSTPGAYFITICTKDRKRTLSDIAVGEGLAPPETHLTAIGRTAEAQLLAIEKRFPSVSIRKYVIMPNHIHLLLVLEERAGGASPSPTVPDVIGAFKSVTTRLCRTHGFQGPVFQRSFHDHVIRGEADYREIWEYIDGNPARWREDCFYTE